MFSNGCGYNSGVKLLNSKVMYIKLLRAWFKLNLINLLFQEIKAIKTLRLYYT